MVKPRMIYVDVVRKIHQLTELQPLMDFTKTRPPPSPMQISENLHLFPRLAPKTIKPYRIAIFEV